MKITQASVLGLLGAASAAPSPRRPDMTAYPLYSGTITAPTTDQIKGCTFKMNDSSANAENYDNGATPALAANTILTYDFYNNQPYACYRSGMWYFPPQTITGGELKGSADTDQADSLGSQGSVIRAFWQVTPTQMGTNFSSATSPTDNSDQTINEWLIGSNANLALANGPKTDANVLYGGNSASGNAWACCQKVHNQASCNGGVDTQITGAITVLAPNRLVLKNGITKASMIGHDATTKPDKAITANVAISAGANGSQAVWDFNTDILLSTMYQNSVLPLATPVYSASGRTLAANDPYCDQIHHEFTAVTSSKITAVTSDGFNGSTKCTYQVSMNSFDGAPTMKVMKADYRNFLFHYIEWLKVSSMAANRFFLPTDTSVAKLGIYGDTAVTTTNGPSDMLFLNPFTGNDASGTWPTASGTAVTNLLKNLHTQMDSEMWMPGSIGKVVWLPKKTGQLVNSQWTTFDAELIKEMYSVSTAGNAAFTALKNTYETDKTAYNDAVKKETTRLADAAMDPPIEIPTRPCPPNAPAAYMGPEILNPTTANTVEAVTVIGASGSGKQYIQGNGGTAAVTANIAGQVNPFFQVNTPATAGDIVPPTTFPADSQANKMGWLQFSEDTTATNYDNNLGHIFGRFGQGADTLPGAKAPFSWTKAISGDKASMSISMFPEEQRVVTGANGATVSSGGGLDAISKTIEIEFEPKAFATLADYVKPTALTTPGAPDAAISAVYLAATSSAAVALALATLY